MRFFGALAVATILVAALPSSAADSLVGLAVYIDDGDTLVILRDDKSQMKIRLSSVDAPETAHTNHEAGRIGQPYANAAKEFLASKVKGKRVAATCFDVDRYGRSVCEVFIEGQSVNVDLVKQGWAWANVASGGRYLRDRSLLELQAAAQKARRGLWAGAKPVPPWEWRTRCWHARDCPN